MNKFNFSKNLIVVGITLASTSVFAQKSGDDSVKGGKNAVPRNYTIPSNTVIAPNDVVPVVSSSDPNAVNAVNGVSTSNPNTSSNSNPSNGNSQPSNGNNSSTVPVKAESGNAHPSPTTAPSGTQGVNGVNQSNPNQLSPNSNTGGVQNQNSNGGGKSNGKKGGTKPANNSKKTGTPSGSTVPVSADRDSNAFSDEGVIESNAEDVSTSEPSSLPKVRNTSLTGKLKTPVPNESNEASHSAEKEPVERDSRSGANDDIADAAVGSGVGASSATPVSGAQAKPVSGTNSCEDEALKEVYRIMASDEHNALAKMYDITAMKVAKQALSQGNVTLEGYTQAKISTLEDEMKNSKDAIKIQESVKAAYLTYGKPADIALINADFDQVFKNSGKSCFWSQKTQLPNKDAAAYVLAASITDPGTGLTDLDAATIWAVDKIREGAGKNYQAGTPNAEKLGFSYRVGKYLGAVQNAPGASLQELEDALIRGEADMVILTVDARSKAREGLIQCLKTQNANCPDCQVKALADFDRKASDFKGLQRGLAAEVSKAQSNKIEKDLKGKAGNLHFDFNQSLAAGSVVLDPERLTQKDSCEDGLQPSFPDKKVMDSKGEDSAAAETKTAGSSLSPVEKKRSNILKAKTRKVASAVNSGRTMPSSEDYYRYYKKLFKEQAKKEKAEKEQQGKMVRDADPVTIEIKKEVMTMPQDGVNQFRDYNREVIFKQQYQEFMKSQPKEAPAASSPVFNTLPTATTYGVTPKVQAKPSVSPQYQQQPNPYYDWQNPNKMAP